MWSQKQARLVVREPPCYFTQLNDFSNFTVKVLKIWFVKLGKRLGYLEVVCCWQKRPVCHGSTLKSFSNTDCWKSTITCPKYPAQMHYMYSPQRPKMYPNFKDFLSAILKPLGVFRTQNKESFSKLKDDFIFLSLCVPKCSYFLYFQAIFGFTLI